jgi:hypothetical protein
MQSSTLDASRVELWTCTGKIDSKCKSCAVLALVLINEMVKNRQIFHLTNLRRGSRCWQRIILSYPTRLVGWRPPPTRKAAQRRSGKTTEPRFGQPRWCWGAVRTRLCTHQGARGVVSTELESADPTSAISLIGGTIGTLECASVLCHNLREAFEKNAPRGRMSRHVEMQNAPPFMGPDREYVKHLEANCVHGEVIDGDQLPDVVLQKGAPRLGRWFPMTDHLLANTGFADVDAQFK